MDDVKYNNSSKKYGPTFPDILFLIFLALAMLGVAWVGSLAYHEGMKTETTKRNGEAWVKWFSNEAPLRGKAGYEPADCATGLVPVAPLVTPAPIILEQVSQADPELKIETPPPIPTSLHPVAPAPRTWGPCLKAITGPGGPLENKVNPFTKIPISLVAKCDMADRSLAGSMALEKTTPTPPGSAIPFISSPLTESDPIDQKMQIRVTMCDKGAYPIRIAELEF